MDLTALIASHRSTLAISDYATYHAYLTRRISSLRRRLGISTAKSQKFTPRQISAEDVVKDRAYLELLLLQAERNWARAMQVKALRGEGSGGLRGHSRSDVISKSIKASKIAAQILELAKNVDSEDSRLMLEAHAYKALQSGGAIFERLSTSTRKTENKEWEMCLRQWSEARVIYAALATKGSGDAARDLLSGTIDPTIRYVAYQAGVSRTVGSVEVSRKYFSKENKAIVDAVEKIDPYAFTGKPKAYGEQVSQTEIPTSVNWRGRRAGIVDANIGQALAAVYAARTKLKEALASTPDAPAKDKAAAYDDILIASQDASDAAKRASDELEKERVDESDSRMQNLRITSLAVNYDLISWRIGRNRVLIDDMDGLHFRSQTHQAMRHAAKAGKQLPVKEESVARQLTRLRERVVLFDSILQSIESIKDLRGAMRDESFVNELEGKMKYFQAMKCLNISISHRLCGEHINALALLSRANKLIAEAASAVSSAASVPLDLGISVETFDEVKSRISSMLAQDHALATLRSMEENSAIASEKHLTSKAPWVQRLDDYPTPGMTVDLKTLVNYPVRIEPVPVKPIFLDIAWNYIEYPGRAPAAELLTDAVNGVQAAVTGSAVGEEKKRGWFGFGR